MDYEDYNHSNSAVVVSPHDSKVELAARYQSGLERCSKEAELRTGDAYIQTRDGKTPFDFSPITSTPSFLLSWLWMFQKNPIVGRGGLESDPLQLRKPEVATTAAEIRLSSPMAPLVFSSLCR